MRLRKDMADRMERWVQEGTGWSDPVEEKTGFVEACAKTTRFWLKTSRPESSEGSDLQTGTRPEAVRREMIEA